LKPLIWVAMFIIGLGITLVGWAFWLEPASLRVAENRLSISTWPSTCDGLRIAVLADLHIGSPFNGLDRLNEVIEQTNKAAPDLVLLPGDFVIQDVVGGTFVPPEEAAKRLKNLHAPIGVFAVLGNHDWVLGADRVKAALETNGIPVLDDKSQLITHNSCQLNLVGISDFAEGPHAVKAALALTTASAPTLVFTHNPDVFPEIPKEIALTIAGHTHGGQVFIPGLGRLVIPSKYGDRYAIGHIQELGKHLFVSSGIGTSILPVRFLVPPEITVLEVFREP